MITCESPNLVAFQTDCAYQPTLKYYKLSPAWALALPAIAMFYTAATVDSALRYWSGRGGAWKGRFQATGNAQGSTVTES